MMKQNFTLRNLLPSDQNGGSVIELPRNFQCFAWSIQRCLVKPTTVLLTFSQHPALETGLALINRTVTE